jgi:hypothetical protein
MKKNKKGEACGALFAMCIVIVLLIGAWSEVGICTFLILLIVMLRFQIEFWSGYNMRRQLQGSDEPDVPRPKGPIKKPH